MSETSRTSGAKTVAYVPFKTWVSLIERFKATAVPHTVDSSVLTHMSGSMRNQVMSALRFLSLIDSTGVVQERLVKLVNAYKTETWDAELQSLVKDAYRDIIDTIDIGSGTRTQLNDAFRTKGHVEGQMRDKAIRFFLASLKESGMQYSPHFSTRKAQSSSSQPKRRRAQNREAQAQDEAGLVNDDVNGNGRLSGMTRIPIPIPGKREGELYLPSGLTEHEWMIVKKMTNFILEAYTERPEKNGGSP